MAQWMLSLSDNGVLDPAHFPELDYYIAGWGINYLSLQMYTLSWFPLIVAITAIAISLVLFVSYWSIVVAVRAHAERARHKSVTCAWEAQARCAPGASQVRTRFERGASEL
eukprot:3130423-Pleurochrysis_carterae.AAC.2